MARFLHRLYASACRKSCYLFLASAWILGLWFGVLFFRYSCSTIVPLIRSAVFSPASFISLFFSLLLPFLFSAFAVYLSCPGLLYLICMMKALIFSCISCGLFYAFPGCGWLVHSLFLFTDQICVILLFVYWCRHSSGLRQFSVTSLFVNVACLSVAAVVDHYIVAPLLNRIMII